VKERNKAIIYTQTRDKPGNPYRFYDDDDDDSVSTIALSFTIKA
jgi:hypothetical protein